MVSFYTVVRLLFLTAQKFNQTFCGLLQFKDDLCSEMIFLNQVPISLAAVFCVPSCHVNVTETVCVQQLMSFFLFYVLGNLWEYLFSPLQRGLLHVNVGSLMETCIFVRVLLKELKGLWICRGNICREGFGLRQVWWMGFQTYSLIICIVPYCSHVN